MREKFGSSGVATGLMTNFREDVVNELEAVSTSARKPTSLSTESKLPRTFQVPRLVVLVVMPVGSHLSPTLRKILIVTPGVAGLTTPWKERSGSLTLGVWTAKKVELLAPCDCDGGTRLVIRAATMRVIDF
jgi:hypothetical protein